jgi:hypothetical protein
LRGGEILGLWDATVRICLNRGGTNDPMRRVGFRMVMRLKEAQKAVYSTVQNRQRKRRKEETLVADFLVSKHVCLPGHDVSKGI